MKNWIDRYVYAVGEKLSKNQREDIMQELRSSILDALDERVEEKRAQLGNSYEATEEDTFSVLEAFGSPSVVAQQYLPNHRYLIGPELFDLYRMVMIIALAGVAIGLTVSTVVSAMESSELTHYIYKLPGELIMALTSAVGSVTIVFAGIQYFAPDHQLNDLNISKPWRAKELSEIPFPYNKIKRSETIVEICFTILAMVVFNFFPDILSLFNFSKGDYIRIPLFDLETLRQYMLFFNIIWIIQIFHHGYNLKMGQWTVGSRLIAMGISFASLAALFFALSDPELINIQVNSYQLPSDIDISHSISYFIGKIFNGILVVVFITTIWECAKHVYYMFKK